MWLKEAPRLQVGLSRPGDCSGVTAGLTCTQSYSLQRPGWKTPAARMCHPACMEGPAENEHAISFPPWAQPRGKMGRQEHFSREIQSSLSQIVPWCAVPLQKGASDPGAGRNGPTSRPVRATTCGTRPGAVGAVGTGLLVLWFLPGD